MPTALFVALLLQQTPPTPTPPAEPVAIEAVKPAADEPGEVKAFAQFVDRHLLTLDPDMQGAFRIRQRDRSFSIRDDDFAEAFKLVPEAYGLATKMMESVRLSTLFMTIGLSTMGAGTALSLIGAALVSSAAFLPVLIAGLVIELLGAVVTLISVPYAVSAQQQFLNAFAVYNKGLLDLRPPREPSGPSGGLSIPLP